MFCNTASGAALALMRGFASATHSTFIPLATHCVAAFLLLPPPIQMWPWEDPTLDQMTLAHRRLEAFFELASKLGFKYWCFHDRYCP